MTRATEPQRKFVPDSLTHLYHTSCFDELSEAQRLKYNHLFGLRINEQFSMFEEVFIRSLMPRLKQHPALKNNQRMLSAIESVLKDEVQHSLLFARFNRGARPDLYTHHHNQFTRLSSLEHSLLRMLLVMPGLLPGLLWLMLAMEELTTAISKELIFHSHSGELDQAYIDLHQRHLEDEKRHVGIDMKLIREIQVHTSATACKLNAFLFRNLFINILRPRRSTIQVISHLAQEEPGLKRLAQTMANQVMTLESHMAFPANLVTAKKLPVLFDLFTHYPDFRLAELGIPAVS